jgi:hypothetical protein
MIVSFVKISAVKAIYNLAAHDNFSAYCSIHGIFGTVWYRSAHIAFEHLHHKYLPREHFSYKTKRNSTYVCTTKPNGILAVKNSVVKSVPCIMEYTICNPVLYLTVSSCVICNECCNLGNTSISNPYK